MIIIAIGERACAVCDRFTLRLVRWFTAGGGMWSAVVCQDCDELYDRA